MILPTTGTFVFVQKSFFYSKIWDESGFLYLIEKRSIDGWNFKKNIRFFPVLASTENDRTQLIVLVLDAVLEVSCGSVFQTLVLPVLDANICVSVRMCSLCVSRSLFTGNSMAVTTTDWKRKNSIVLSLYSLVQSDRLLLAILKQNN